MLTTQILLKKIQFAEKKEREQLFMEILKRPFGNEIHACVFIVPWDLALGLGSPMVCCTWVGRPHGMLEVCGSTGRYRCMPGCETGEQSRPTLSWATLDPKQACLSHPTLFDQQCDKIWPKWMGCANLRWKKFWIFHRELLLYNGSYNMMTQNGHRCKLFSRKGSQDQSD